MEKTKKVKQKERRDYIAQYIAFANNYAFSPLINIYVNVVNLTKNIKKKTNS